VIEVIATSVEDAIAAQNGGAQRIELVSHFEVGGLTPSVELAQAVLDVVTIPVRVMLRERNSFEVDEAETKRLCAFAEQFAKMKVDGLVLGFLRGGEIDTRALSRVLACAPNQRVTFHRAFELIGNPIDAVRLLKHFPQVDTILTSGGEGEWREKAARLSSLQTQAQPKIEVLVGGGINLSAMTTLIRFDNLRAFHLGRAAREPQTIDGVVSAERVSNIAALLMAKNN
jgi:copper homeostasis protein